MEFQSYGEYKSKINKEKETNEKGWLRKSLFEYPSANVALACIVEFIKY